MSRIRMHVYISNESDATLSFVRDEIPDGDYTPDWAPPPVINPGQRIGFQGEGDLTPMILKTVVDAKENVLITD